MGKLRAPHPYSAPAMNTFKKKPKLKTPAGTKNSDALTKSAGVKGRRAGFPTSGPEGLRLGRGRGSHFLHRLWGFVPVSVYTAQERPPRHWASCRKPAGESESRWGPTSQQDAAPLPCPEPPEEGCRRRRLRRSPPIPGMLDVGCRGADCSSEMKAERSPRGGSVDISVPSTPRVCDHS